MDTKDLKYIVHQSTIIPCVLAATLFPCFEPCSLYSNVAFFHDQERHAAKTQINKITEQVTVGHSNALKQWYGQLFRSLIWWFIHITHAFIMEYKGRNSFDAAFKLNVIDLSVRRE